MQFAQCSKCVRILPQISRPIFLIRSKHSYIIDPANEWDIHKDRPPKVTVGPTPEKFNYYQSAIWPKNFADEEGKAKVPEVYHYRENIRGNEKKYFSACLLARGRAIDDAIMQLNAVPQKHPRILAEILLEAQEKAVTECNIKFRSNLWVADAQASNSMIVKGMRKHARMRFGIIKYRFCNIMVYLQEGSPPPYYTREKVADGWDKMKEHIKYLRDRKLKYSL